MAKRSLFFTVLILVVSSHLGFAAAAATQPPVLSIAQPSEVVVKPDSGASTATTEIVVLDPGAGVPVSVTFKGAGDSPIRVKNVDPSTLEAQGATTLTLTLTGVDELDGAAAGAFVVSGGAAPVAVAAKVEPPLDPSVNWIEAIAIGALAAMAILALGVLALAAKNGKIGELTNSAPGPKWSFSSWATTLTAVGGTLGTILASITFPDHPHQIEKNSLVALSLLFAGLVVVAPFVFQGMRSPKASSTDQEAGRWGYNWALLLACSITCGAVLGELACLTLLSQELISGGFWAGLAEVAIFLLGVLTVWYFFVTAYQLATSTWPAVQATVKAGDGKSSILIGTAAAEGARAEDGEPPTPAEAPVVSIQNSWNLP